MASKPSQSLSTAAAQAEGPVQRANDGVEYSDLPAANDSTGELHKLLTCAENAARVLRSPVLRNVVCAAGYQQPANSSAQSASAKLSKTKLKRKNHLADKKAERRKQVHEKKVLVPYLMSKRMSLNGKHMEYIVAYMQRQKNPEDARKDNSESNAFKLEVVPFGEVADAPPAVSLKRKNHVDGKACRHSVALQKHLEAGQARLMQGTKVNSTLLADVCSRLMTLTILIFGSYPQGCVMQDLADARAAAMGAYRAGRRKQTDEGEKNANMESLKALVNSQSPKVQTAV